MREMQRQQEMASKEAYEEHLLKQVAINSGAKLIDLKNGANAETQTEKAEEMLSITGTNTKHQPTSSSAMNTEHQPTSSSAMITEQQETATIGTSTGTEFYDINDKGSAIASNYEKIEELMGIAELQQQQQEIRHKEQVETIRQQALSQLRQQAERHQMETQRLTQINTGTQARSNYSFWPDTTTTRL